YLLLFVPLRRVLARCALFPYTTLFRSLFRGVVQQQTLQGRAVVALAVVLPGLQATDGAGVVGAVFPGDTERRFHFAVVELADDHWLVDVPLAELDQDLAIDSGQEVGAPVGTCQDFRHRHPNPRRRIAGGMARLGAAGIVKATGVRGVPTLPSVLDAHLVVAAASDGVAGVAHHSRQQRA